MHIHQKGFKNGKFTFYDTIKTVNRARKQNLRNRGYDEKGR